jgi:NAD(P)-dependent dehydrogenase (short-subunit alcohol dehydrogenase family)
MQNWIEAAGPLDLVLACAGISGGPNAATADRGAQEDPHQIRQILAVNLDGVLNTVLPAIATMERQPREPDGGTRGRIAAIASVAASVSSPKAPTYCASKAAVDRWMVATGANLAPAGILMSSVCCGFVRSRMTARNDFPMPGLMDADRAAALILRGIAGGRRRIVFPWWMQAGARMMDLLPLRLTEAMLARQPGKNTTGA